MCDPVTLAVTSAGLGIGQAGLGFSAAKKQAQATNEAAAQTAVNSSRAAERNFSNLQIRSQQEAAASADQAQQTEIEKSQAIASAEMASEAGGVGGMAVSTILRSIYSQAGRAQSTLDANLQMSRDYLTGELQSAHDSAQSGANSAPIAESPNPLGYALEGFSSGLSAYTNKLKMEAN